MTWHDLEDAQHCASDRACGRLLRALAVASFLIVDLPSAGRLAQARRATAAQGDLPSHLELLDRLRRCLQHVGADPDAIAPIVIAPDADVRAVLRRLGGHERTFDAAGDALQWLFQQPRPLATRIRDEPGDDDGAMSGPSPAGYRVVIADWGGDVGHRFLCGLHGATEQAFIRRSAGRPLTALAGEAGFDLIRAPATAAYGRAVLEFGPPPRSIRPAPPWKAKFARGGGAADARRVDVTYEGDIDRADVIVAGVGHDAQSAEPGFVRILERSWSRHTPVLLLVDHAAAGRGGQRGELLRHWVASGFPGAPSARLSSGRELQTVARALALAPAATPHSDDSAGGKARLPDGRVPR